MDIATLSRNMAYMDVSTKVGVAVLDKALENYEQSSAEILKMMQQMVPVDYSLGGNVDLRV